ncbi:MAG: hypothetical protein ACOCSQ_00575 [Planctomycetota bacterium]
MIFRRRKPMVIALHAGRRWYAVVYRYHDGEWHPETREHYEYPNARQLPDEMLSWAVEQEATRLRVVIHGDVHTMEMDLPEDAESEEIHTAITYEAAPQLDVDAHLLRVSAVRTDQYRMGGDPDVVAIAGYEQPLLEQYAEDCDRHGLDFEGVAPLELVALNRHARISSTERLVVLRQHAGFLAVPAGEDSDFFLGMLAFGADPMDEEAEEERIARSQRSFRIGPDTPVHVVSTHPLSDKRIETLQRVVGEDIELHVESMEEFAPAMLKHVVLADAGRTDHGSAVVNLPPEPVDPRRYGTWGCAAIVLISAALLGFVWSQHLNRLQQANEHKERWTRLKEKRREAENRYEKLTEERSMLEKTDRILRETKPLPAGILSLLKVLTSDMPPYTRICSITHTGDRIEVKGRSMRGHGVNVLTDSIDSAMRTRKYRVEPGTVSLAEGEHEHKFSYHLVPTRR